MGKVPVVISVAEPEEATAAKPSAVFAAAASASARRERPKAVEATPARDVRFALNGCAQAVSF